MKAITVPFRSLPWNWLPDWRLRSRRNHVAEELQEAQASNFYRSPCNSCRPIGLFAATAVLVGLPALVQAQTTARTDGDAATHDLQRVVDGLRDRMGIVEPVQVTMVERDVRMLSVRRSAEVGGGFALAAERGFIATLPVDQVEAALAHELGHVWIYTHHPYLQTEQLANRVAMRVVSRDRLVEVYRVLWGADAVHGSLEAFLGVEAAR